MCSAVYAWSYLTVPTLLWCWKIFFAGLTPLNSCVSALPHGMRYSVHQVKVAWNVAKERMSKEYKRWVPQEDFAALFLDPFSFSAHVKLSLLFVWTVTVVMVAFTHHMRKGKCQVIGWLPSSSKPMWEALHFLPDSQAVRRWNFVPGHHMPTQLLPCGWSWLCGAEELGALFRNCSESHSESPSWPHSFDVSVGKQKNVASSTLLHLFTQ